jgi:hypothetical protein
MKDKSVLDVVSWLEESLSQKLLAIDHWDADMYAIGIARADHPNELVYVSTWNRPPDRYLVEIESAPSAGVDLPYTTVARHDDVDRDDLLRIVREHLSL